MILTETFLLTPLKISISVGLSISIIILLCALIIVSVYFYYRRTIPFLESNWKVFLAVLRGLAIIGILLAVAELTLNISSVLETKSTSIFLIDNSKSMLHDQNSLNRVIANMKNVSDSDKAEYQVYYFSETLADSQISLRDNLLFNGPSTDISSALERVNGLKDDWNLQNVILITDGIYNKGDKPIHIAEKLHLPIITLGVGNPTIQKDLIVKDIISNDILYVDNKSPVKVSLINNGFDSREVEVSLREDGKHIETKKIKLADSFNEIDFEYIPKSDGDKRLTISANAFMDEVTPKNNSSSKYVSVLSNKIKVLLVASAPSVDLSFIKQSLSVNNDYNVKTLVENSTGGFLPNSSDKNFLDSADAVFFIGFPGKFSSHNFIDELKSSIQRKNLPLFTLISNEADFTRLQLFNDFLPFEWGNPYGDVSQIFIDIREGFAKNEILNIDESNSINIWNAFPPIFRVDREFRSKPESEILSFFKIQNSRINQPLILSRKINRHRSIAFIGFGIWRLKLLNALKTNENEYFDRFINNSVKWLSSRELFKNLKLNLSKKIFDSSERVVVSGQFYDESNHAVSNANISLDIFRENQTIINANLEPIGNGLYQFILSDLTEGDYSLKVSTEYGGQKFSDEAKFSVTETELEYQNLTMNEDLLKQIAEVSGGKYFSAEESNQFFSNISSFLSQRKIEKEVSDFIQFWNSIYLLIGVMLLLAAEWFFRKRLGLL